jgi:hypothetical protein
VHIYNSDSIEKIKVESKLCDGMEIKTSESKKISHAKSKGNLECMNIIEKL